MDPMSIATLVLTLGAKAAELASQAIEASRAGDDQRALDLLDAALGKLQAGMSDTRAELDAIKGRVAKRIEDKFPDPAPVAPPKNAE